MSIQAPQELVLKRDALESQLGSMTARMKASGAKIEELEKQRKKLDHEYRRLYIIAEKMQTALVLEHPLHNPPPQGGRLPADGRSTYRSYYGEVTVKNDCLRADYNKSLLALNNVRQQMEFVRRNRDELSNQVSNIRNTHAFAIGTARMTKAKLDQANCDIDRITARMEAARERERQAEAEAMVSALVDSPVSKKPLFRLSVTAATFVPKRASGCDFGTSLSNAASNTAAATGENIKDTESEEAFSNINAYDFATGQEETNSSKRFSVTQRLKRSHIDNTQADVSVSSDPFATDTVTNALEPVGQVIFCTGAPRHQRR